MQRRWRDGFLILSAGSARTGTVSRTSSNLSVFVTDESYPADRRVDRPSHSAEQTRLVAAILRLSLLTTFSLAAATKNDRARRTTSERPGRKTDDSFRPPPIPLSPGLDLFASPRPPSQVFALLLSRLPSTRLPLSTKTNLSDCMAGTPRIRRCSRWSPGSDLASSRRNLSPTFDSVTPTSSPSAGQGQPQRTRGGRRCRASLLPCDV